jgi:High-affinity Fe2+/Pb2+ permease
MCVTPKQASSTNLPSHRGGVGSQISHRSTVRAGESARTFERLPGILLKALFGYRERLYLLQAVGYTIFLVTVGSLYFPKLGGKPNVARKITQSAREQAS